MLVDRDQGHRLAAGFAPAEMEGADIDSGLAETGTEPADEAGRVLVDDIDHLALKLGFYRDSENLDQARRSIAEQRARDGARAVGGRGGHSNEGMIVALPVVPYLAKVEAAFLRQERRVDHVHRVGMDSHQTRQHRSGDWLRVQLRGRAFNLDRHSGQPLAFDLPNQGS